MTYAITFAYASAFIAATSVLAVALVIIWPVGRKGRS